LLGSNRNGCERSGIHSRAASGGSGGCAASTPQFNYRRADKKSRSTYQNMRATEAKSSIEAPT
jgi:hypothetical protein